MTKLMTTQRKTVQRCIYCCASRGSFSTKEHFFPEAVKWFRKSAEQNYAPAQHNLGVAYAFGEAVTQDEVEAVKWFQKAAAQNIAEAQYNLGASYCNGRGVAQDYAEAMHWYRKAAEQNYAQAQYVLGIAYTFGEAVPQDEVEAYKWTFLAAAQGLEDAKEAMTRLEDTITREQIAEAQKLARNFQSRETPR
jgi:TPR repeat protein